MIISLEFFIMIVKKYNGNKNLNDIIQFCLL